MNFAESGIFYKKHFAESGIFHKKHFAESGICLHNQIKISTFATKNKQIVCQHDYSSEKPIKKCFVGKRSRQVKVHC